MEGWISFWKAVIYTGLALFAVLSAWVIVAGFGDIKKMFAALKEGENEE